MAFKRFDEIEKTERDDFETACKKRGLTASDFEVTVEESLPVQGIGHLKRTAYVRRTTKKDGIKYPAGSGTHWLVDFEADLLSGKYD